jgi:hypothetical protein
MRLRAAKVVSMSRLEELRIEIKRQVKKKNPTWRHMLEYAKQTPEYAVA